MVSKTLAAFGDDGGERLVDSLARGFVRVGRSLDWEIFTRNAQPTTWYQ